jgi:hypothetical protein
VENALEKLVSSKKVVHRNPDLASCHTGELAEMTVQD